MPRHTPAPRRSGKTQPTFFTIEGLRYEQYNGPFPDVHAQVCHTTREGLCSIDVCDPDPHVFRMLGALMHRIARRLSEVRGEHVKTNRAKSRQ